MMIIDRNFIKCSQLYSKMDWNHIPFHLRLSVSIIAYWWDILNWQWWKLIFMKVKYFLKKGIWLF